LGSNKEAGRKILLPRHGAGLTYFIAIFAGRAGRRPASELRKVSCISLFFANTRHPPRAAARAARATKNPARHAARASGVLSVSIFFWKILVTRVKRKIELR
jgi:hypothetical protein